MCLSTRGEKKCTPGLPEDRRYATGWRNSWFFPRDQNQEGQHGEMCQSLQSQQKTPLQLQVSLLVLTLLFQLQGSYRAREIGNIQNADSSLSSSFMAFKV